MASIKTLLFTKKLNAIASISDLDYNGGSGSGSGAEYCNIFHGPAFFVSC